MAAHEHHLERLAVRLAKAAPLLLNKDGDWDPFYDVLDEVLALTDPDDESFVINTVLDHFREHHPDRATNIVATLLAEFEVESEYHARSTQDGLERGCVLFAIPFVCAAGEAVPAVFRRTSDVRTLEGILREAQVVGDVAEFRLVPRVFSLHELYGRSFGEYFRMVRYWGDQLLDEGELDGAGPEHLAVASTSAKTLPQANNPFVQLHFLVGVLAARKGDLSDAFPAPVLRTSEATDDEPSALPDEPADPFKGEPEVGEMEGGEDWEVAFCDELMLALELMRAPLAALMPSGLHEDMSAGVELEREVGLQHQFRLCLENGGLDSSAVSVEQAPVRELGGSPQGWLVSLYEAGSSELLEEVEWPLLAHEAPADCSMALRMALDGVGLELEDDGRPLDWSAFH